MNADKDVVRRSPSLARVPTRRAFLRGAAAGGGLLALSGCATAPQPAVRSGDLDLELWTHDPSYVTTFETAAADAAIMSGSAFTPRIRPVSANGSDLVSRTITEAVAGQSGPDLLGIIISEFPRVMKDQMSENLFVDLSDLASEYGDDLLRTSPYTVDGKLYAVESDSSISVFYYRSDEFEAQGIDPDLATWDDFLEVGADLNARTGQAIGMVSNGDNTSIYNSFLQYFLQRGGAPFDEDGNLTIDTDEAVDVLDFMQRGVQSGALLVLGDPYGSSAATALASSRLIATVMPSWYNLYGLQTNAPDQAGLWRMRTIPAFSGGGHIASNLGGTGFAVGLASSNRLAAQDLLRRTYLSEEGQLLRYQIGGYLPTLRSLYELPAFTDIEDEFLGGQRVFDVYGPAADDLPDFYQAETAQQLSVAMGGPLLQLFAGDLDPAGVVRAATEGYKQQTRQA